jgi:prophage DNA circulation protein
MGWEERLKEAAYTPPSGARITFTFENVSRETDKKTTVFMFPDNDGAYIQDQGLGGRRYPLRVIFWGEDYDQDAQAFYSALEEEGGGILEHPVYGRKEVVPFGTIRQRDDLKTAANQAIIDVIFWESIFDLTFPTATTAPTSAVAAAIEDFKSTAPAQFAEGLDIEASSERVGFIDKFSAGLAATKSALDTVAAASEDIKRQFDAAYDAIITNINDLVETPSQLASDTIDLMLLPGQAASLISDKLDAYSNLIDNFTSLVFAPSFDNQPENELISVELFANSAVAAIVVATTEAEFTAKPEAISAAEVTLENFAQVAAWGDAGRDALGVIDTGETYQAVLEAVSVSSGRLVEISFTLLQEKIFTLQRPRTPLDLVAELYGELDDKLDFLISSNNLVGTEILEVPIGREIRYYE